MTEEAASRPQPSQLDIMIDDLTKRVASISLEAASWKARALTAERSLAELAAEAEAIMQEEDQEEPEDGTDETE